MFKALKRKMLLFNLGIFSILLIAIFASLYLSTYTNIQQRTNAELLRILNANPNPSGGDILPPDPSFSIGFSVLVVDNEVVDSMSDIEYEDDWYNQAYQLTTEIDGTIELDDYIFRYQAKETNNGTVIAFVDYTEDQTLLNQTLLIYSIVFVIALGLTTLISNYITNRSIKPVEEGYAKQKEFIANASHELKTPLTVINTNIDVLLSSKEYQDNKWLRYIKSEATRMSNLTEDLLYLARTGDNLDLQLSECNLSDKLESVLLGIEALAYEKRINLTYDFTPNLVAEFNEDQFNQLAMVLLDNAIKYTPTKGDIKVSLFQSDQIIKLTVTNTGNGITELEQKLLFDRFYKVDKSRTNSRSFGLGLSIAKAICDAHHASISVTSEPSTYTEFVVTIKS